jgi:hypothetical protein
LPPKTSPTKAEAIIDLLVNSKNSDKAISRMTNTTLSYVRKVKCEHRKAKYSAFEVKGPFGGYRLYDDQILSGEGSRSEQTKTGIDNTGPAGVADTSDRISDIEVKKMKMTTSNNNLDGSRQRTKSNAYAHHYVNPISNDERRQMWADFDSNKTPVDIIKIYGFAPHLVEHEYLEYLRLAGVSLSEMQHNVILRLKESMDYFIKGPLMNRYDELEALTAEYKDRGRLGIRRFASLVEIYKDVGFQKGKESINNISEPLAKGWQRPPCFLCSKPLGGVIVDLRYGADYVKEIHELWNGWIHEVSCSNR